MQNRRRIPIRAGWLLVLLGCIKFQTPWLRSPGENGHNWIARQQSMAWITGRNTYGMCSKSSGPSVFGCCRGLEIMWTGTLREFAWSPVVSGVCVCMPCHDPKIARYIYMFVVLLAWVIQSNILYSNIMNDKDKFSFNPGHMEHLRWSHKNFHCSIRWMIIQL